MGGEGISGMKHSPETKAKISAAHKGKKYRLGSSNSTAHNNKISKALKGKEYSLERKRNWYLNCKGKNLEISNVEKERSAVSERQKGEKGSNSKLTEIQVREIKNLLKEGLSGVTIAKMFGVGKSAIGDIGRGRCWSHVII